MNTVKAVFFISLIFISLFSLSSIISPILAESNGSDYYPYGGGAVRGQILGFNWFNELTPVIWADVTAWQDGELIASATSGGNGYYFIILPVGFYTLRIEEPRYIEKSMEIFVSSGSASSINFVLELDYEYYKEQKIDTFNVTISIKNVPSDLYSNIWVDDVYDGIIKGESSKTLIFQDDSDHLIKVDKVINGTYYTRFVINENAWKISSGSTHDFVYESEFYVTFNTVPENIDVLSLEDWYPKGEVMNASASKLFNLSSKTRLAFDSWLVDGVKFQGDTLNIIIDKPFEILLKYVNEYYVAVESDLGDPKGSGWYQEGSVAEISIDASEGVIIKKVFDSWSGDYQGNTPQASIIIEQPMIINTEWRTDYTILILIIILIMVSVILSLLFLYLYKRGSR